MRCLPFAVVVVLLSILRTLGSPATLRRVSPAFGPGPAPCGGVLRVSPGVLSPCGIPILTSSGIVDIGAVDGALPGQLTYWAILG